MPPVPQQDSETLFGASKGAPLEDLFLMATDEAEIEKKKKFFSFVRSSFKDITFTGVGVKPEDVNGSFGEDFAQKDTLTAVIKTIMEPQVETTFMYQTTEDPAVNYMFETVPKRWEESHIKFKVTEYNEDQPDRMSLGTIPTVGTYTEAEKSITTAIYGKAYDAPPFELETTNRALADRHFSNNRKAAMLSVERAITNVLFTAIVGARPTWVHPGKPTGASMTRSALQDAACFPAAVGDGRRFSTVDLRGEDNKTNRALGVISSLRDIIIDGSSRISFEGAPIAASVPGSIMLAEQTMRDIRNQQSTFGPMSDYFDEKDDYYYYSNMYIGTSRADCVSKRMAEAMGEGAHPVSFSEFAEEQRSSPNDPAQGPKQVISRIFTAGYAGDGMVGRAIHKSRVSELHANATYWDEDGELKVALKRLAVQVREFAAANKVDMIASAVDNTDVLDPFVTEERSAVTPDKHVFAPAQNVGAVFCEFFKDASFAEGSKAYVDHCMDLLGAEDTSALTWLIGTVNRNLDAARMPYADTVAAWTPLRFWQACQAAVAGASVGLATGIRESVGCNGMPPLYNANGTFGYSAADAPFNAPTITFTGAGDPANSRRYSLNIGAWKSPESVVIPGAVTVAALEYFLAFPSIDPAVYKTWTDQLTAANSLTAFNEWVGKIGKGLEALRALVRILRSMHSGNDFSDASGAPSAHLYAVGDMPAPFLSESYYRSGPSSNMPGEAGYGENASLEGVLDAFVGDRCGAWLTAKARGDQNYAGASNLTKLLLAAGVERVLDAPAEVMEAATEFLKAGAADFITLPTATLENLAAVAARIYAAEEAIADADFTNVDENLGAMREYATLFARETQRYAEAARRATSTSQEYRPMGEEMTDAPNFELYMARAWPIAAGSGMNAFARYNEFAAATAFRRTSFATRYSSMASATAAAANLVCPGRPEAPAEWPALGRAEETFAAMRTSVSGRLKGVGARMAMRGSTAGFARAAAQRISHAADSLRRSTPWTRRMALATNPIAAANTALFSAVPLNAAGLSYISENVPGGIAPVRAVKVAWAQQLVGQAGFVGAKAAGLRIIGTPTTASPQSVSVGDDLAAGTYRLFFASGSERSVNIDPKIMIEARNITPNGIKNGFFMCSTGAAILHTDEFVALPLASVTNAIGGCDPHSYTKALPDSALFDGTTGHNLVLYTAYSAKPIIAAFSLVDFPDRAQAFPGHACGLYLAGTREAFENSCSNDPLRLDTNSGSMREIFNAEPCLPVRSYPAPVYHEGPDGKLTAIATGSGPVSHIRPPATAPITTPVF